MELTVTETQVEDQTTEVGKYSDDKFTNAALTAIHGEAPAPVEKPAETVEKTVTETFDIDKIVSEKTGGKFTKFDDLIAAPKEVPAELKFENEDSKQVYQLLSEGKIDEVVSILAERGRDYSQIADADVLKLAAKKEKPYLSDADLDDYLLDQYGFGESITEEDRVDLSPAMLKEKEARIARNSRIAKREAAEQRLKLTTTKADLKLPQITQAKPVDQAAVDAKTAEDAALQEWTKQTDAGSKSSPEKIDHKFSVDVLDGNSKVSYSIPFVIEGEEKKALDNYVKNFYPILGNWTDYVKDDKVDVARIREEGIDRLFGKKMFSILLKEATAKTKQSVIGGLKNLTDTSKELVPNQPMSNEEWLLKKAMHT